MESYGGTEMESYTYSFFYSSANKFTHERRVPVSKNGRTVRVVNSVTYPVDLLYKYRNFVNKFHEYCSIYALN